MILDQQQPIVVGETVVFPDWPFAAVPKQPSQIKETVIKGASTAGTTIRIKGASDQRESAC